MSQDLKERLPIAMKTVYDFRWDFETVDLFIDLKPGLMKHNMCR